jgi:hypothetical protein
MAYQQQRRRGRSFNHGRNRRPAPGKKYIHPSKFINKAVPKAEETPYAATHQFADFPFGSELHHNISLLVRFRIKRSHTLSMVVM